MADVVKFLTLTIVYAAASGYGLFLMKSSGVVLAWKFACGVFFYGAAFLLWLWILRSFPLTIAFPAAAGTLIVSTQIFGFWLNETMTLPKAGALMLIVVGIAMLSTEVK